MYLIPALALAIVAAVVLLAMGEDGPNSVPSEPYVPSQVQLADDSQTQAGTQAPVGPETELATQPATEPPSEPEEDPDGWKLTLVNVTHAIADDAYPTELTDLFNGEQVDSRIYPDLQRMFDDARAQGVYPLVNEGYRTHARQQELMDQRVEQYIAEGNDEETARQLAEAWVAVPGTSEHELGLAVDIVADTDLCDNETVYAWLRENAHLYGFILRYPEDKVEITGIDYEPWHYRYVGHEAAEEIYETGVCLEEYLQAG